MSINAHLNLELEKQHVPTLQTRKKQKGTR